MSLHVLEEPTLGSAWQMNVPDGKVGSKLGMLSVVLEKSAQVAQIVIAIALLVLCHECSALNTLVADMKIDQGKNSPLTEILSTGIQVRLSQALRMLSRLCALKLLVLSVSRELASAQNGAGNTFTDMDVLGLAALRNGTWIPAMVNSVSTPFIRAGNVQSPRVGTAIATPIPSALVP